MAEAEVLLVGQSRNIEVVTRTNAKIRAVNSAIVIDRNEHFLSLSGFGNKVTVRENLGRIELVGEDNHLTIEKDFTSWVTCRGRNEIAVGEVLLEEGHRRIEGHIDNCTICYSPFHIADPNIEIMKCKHAMHKECFSQYTIRYSHCPLCKTQV